MPSSPRRRRAPSNSVGALRPLHLALAALLALAISVAPAVAGSQPTAHAATGGFFGLTPARLWDTRNGPGITTVDGTNLGTGRLGPDQSFALQVNGRGGVPLERVGAVAINITAIDPSAPSYLTAYTDAAPRPTASNLNMAPGRTLPNVAIVEPFDGKIRIYNAAGTTDVAVDVLGWFDESGAYNGIPPARLLETRSGPGLSTIDGQALGVGRLGPDSTYRLRVNGRGGVPTGGVGAVALNVTAVDPDAPSFVTVFPAGGARPTASNLNTDPGRTLPNMVIVPVSAAGEIDLYNFAGTTDLIVDVLGWFASGPDSLQPLTPARLWETRNAPGLTTVDGQQQGTGRMGAGATGTVQVTGRAGIPQSGVGAVALNVTAINPDSPSYLTVHPTGSERPAASNLNNAPGRTLPNMVIVPVSLDGQVDVYNAFGTTDVVVDVLGWFPGTGATTDPGGRLYYSGITGVEYTDLDRLLEFAGPEAIDHDTEFAVNASGTEFTYGIDDFPDTQVVIADLATGDIRKTFFIPGISEPWSLVYPSPDDTRYAVLVSDPEDTFGPSQLFIYDRNGNEVDFLDNARAFQWAADGSIVVLADPFGTGTYDLRVFPAAGGTYVVHSFTRAFDDLPTDLAVSPDVSLIAYADQSAVSVVPFDGGAAPKRIVESFPDLGEPEFSPDGTFLALSRDGDSGFLLKCDGIYIVPVVLTGDPVYLIGGDNDPYKLIVVPFSRVTSCGQGIFWR